MNSKQIMKNVMDLKPVERIPFMCQMSIGHMLLQLKCSPMEFWFDPNVYVDGLIRLRQLYQFDGILISLHGHDPNWYENVESISKTDKAEIGYFKNGEKIICYYNELPQYEIINQNTETRSDDKLPKELTYIPVSQNLPFYIHPKYKFDVIYDVISKVGNKYSIHGEITSPFDYFMDFLGHQNALMELLVNPEHAHFILQHFTNLVSQLADEMCSTGIDAIKISSPFAGSNFISPEQYLEFVFPYEKQIIEIIRENKIHAYLHTCGTINDRLEYMFEGGANGIECLDPKPLGDVDLSDAVKRIGDRGFIKGNIDSVNLLMNSSLSEIEKEIKKIIAEGKKAKGFILSTACSISPSVKKENIQIISSILKS